MKMKKQNEKLKQNSLNTRQGFRQFLTIFKIYLEETLKTWKKKWNQIKNTDP